VDYLAAQGVLGPKWCANGHGKYGEIHTYRYAQSACFAKRAACHAVNWCEWTVRREDTGEQLYRNAFITDFEVEETNVEAIARDGRTRWKVENENTTFSKPRLSYRAQLRTWPAAPVFLAPLLNLLAFRCTRSWNWWIEVPGHPPGSGKTPHFLSALEACSATFSSIAWDDVFQFMYYGLELDTG